MKNKTKNHPFTSAILAGAAVIATAGAAWAAPVYNTYSPSQQGLYPQTPPVMVDEYVYTRTEVTRTPQVTPQQYLDNDANYQAATVPMRQTETVAVTNPHNIRYMTGGVGQGEQQRLQAAEAEFPVKVVFANSNGAFMSDVDVTVKDSAGNTVLGLTTDGPVLLMDLKPGNYTLTANDNGTVKTQKLQVGEKMRSYTMHFKTNEPLGYDRHAGL